jgi:hypothetical protein
VNVNVTDKADADDLQSRVGFKAGYDFGIAKVTYGQLKSDNGTSANGDNTETGLVLSVPMGAITVDASYATSKTGTAAKLTGTGLKATYALSKRTSIAFYTEKHDRLADATKEVEETSLKITHKF